MADTLVERVTGQTDAEAVPIEIQLVMSDHTLMSADLADNRTPARIPGFGPVPAPLARSWVRDSPADVWVRRLYSRPTTGSLVAMDSRRRRFTGKLRAFVVARDSVCRTPWCGAPIRHLDHTHRAADGGVTSSDNGQGLCVACNQAKEAPGWRTAPAGDDSVIELPTGARVTSRPPPPLLPLPPPRLRSRAEFTFHHLLVSA